MLTIDLFCCSQSFRFGPEIAQVASCCLERLKGETKKTLVGNGNPGEELQLSIVLVSVRKQPSLACVQRIVCDKYW